MRTILSLAIFFFSDLALAGGRLLIKPVYEEYPTATSDARWTYYLGLPVLEEIPYLPISYEGYTGVVLDSQRQLEYVRVEQGATYAAGPIVVGLAATMDYYYQPYRVVHGGFGYLSITLW